MTKNPYISYNYNYNYNIAILGKKPFLYFYNNLIP